MVVLLFIVAGVVLVFGFVVFFGAPYLPSMKRQIQASLDLLNLREGQTLLEIGCGDGRVMRAGAERGLRVIGYELNPILVIFARIHTWKYRKQVQVRWGNFWQANWPETDGIYVFLLDKYMKKLDKVIIQTYGGRPVKLVSFAFRIPGKKVTKELNGVYLYTYK